MSTPTAAQIEALFNFLEKHRDLARGNLRSVEGRTQSHRLWEEICTTLNAMGGCTKTTKQWQKVWTDKKYLAKKAVGAARKSASATGGGPSMAPPLSQWELKVISLMGDGFGEPQTSARVPAFPEHVTQETSNAASMQCSQEGGLSQQTEHLPGELRSIDIEDNQIQPSTSQHMSAIPASNDTITYNPTTSIRRRRQSRRHLTSPLAASSVRDRLFELEERRVVYEEQRNSKLDAMTAAIVEFCRYIQQLIDEFRQSRRE